MASLSDLILQQVKSATGNVEIPSNVKESVINGLSGSIFDSLKQTASKAGGLDQIKDLFTGKTSAAASPISGLASSIFTNNVLGKLNLGPLGSSLTGLIPSIIGSVSNLIKDQDGDGDVDLNDILLTLKGGSGGLLGAAGSLLGGLLKKR